MQFNIVNDLELYSSPTKLKTFLLCTLSGILLGLSFPPFRFWFFVYFGLVILLLLILSSRKYRIFFRRSFYTLLVFNAITLYWVSGWESNDIFLKLGGVATVLVHPLFFMIPLLITYIVKRRFNYTTALVTFPVVWTAFEYWHNTGELAFPWLELGNTETYNTARIQYIEYTGIHGTTFLICIITCLLLFATIQIYLRKWSFGSFKSISALIVMIILIILPVLISHYRFENVNPTLKNYEQNKLIKVSLIQSNVNPFIKWKGNPDSLIDTYINKIKTASAQKSDINILHETAPPYYFLEPYNASNTKKFFNVVDSCKIPLLMGIPHLQYYSDASLAPKTSREIKSTGQRYDAFNSVILIEPDKGQQDLTIHKKVKLVPFSERTPYAEHLPFLKNLIKWGVGISSWQAGDSIVLFNLPASNTHGNVKFASLICFESVFSEYVSEAVKNGAEFLVIVTNDGWFGNSSGPIQHQQYAILRAIENRKWIVRCAQTGISSLISPLGEVTQQTDLNTEAILTGNIQANNYITFYSEKGDYIGKTCFYITGLVVITCFLSYAKRRIVKRKA